MKQGRIKLIFIVIVVIALAAVMAGYLAIVNPFVFAGFTWTDSGDVFMQKCGGFSSSATLESGFVNIDSSVSNQAGKQYIETDITGVDEILVIYDGFAAASCNNGYPNYGGSIIGAVAGSASGEISMAQTASTSKCPSGGDSVSLAFPPSIWKFKNNFDGTWSSLQGLGVGDIFIVQGTSVIIGNPKLRLGTSIGGQCGGQGSARAHLKVYNVVRKENAFAVCKADKYAFDKNNDGKIASDGSECFDLKTIVLNSEEAIKESYNEKLARVTAELEAKNAGLTADISALKQQIALQQTTPYDDALLQKKVNALQEELSQAKQQLANVQAKDPTVINTIIYQEQIKQPNVVIQWWNKLIAWLKGLFA